MFVKKNIAKVRGKEYISYVLTETIRTAKGPRHKSIISLGSLEPKPAEEWLKLAHRVECALIGLNDFIDPMDAEVAGIVEKIRKRKLEKENEEKLPETITINPAGIETEEHRELGPALAVSLFWDKLDMDGILKRAGVPENAVKLTQITVANRLISPSSDYSISDWVKRSAILELSGFEKEKVSDDSVYRLLDTLYPKRVEIEKELVKVEENLFNMENALILIDFTSEYFEGSCYRNPKGKRGYSRDKRPDCKQVVLGMGIGAEGFPVASEIFAGNSTDSPTFREMFPKMKRRLDMSGKTLIFDRGIATEINMKFLENQEEKYKWIIADGLNESDSCDELFESVGWQTIELKGKVAGRKKPTVQIGISETVKGHTRIMVKSEGRTLKDRAIRQRQENKIEECLKKLEDQAGKGKLKTKEKIYEQIGRIRERYTRAGRYFDVTVETGEKGKPEVKWKKNIEKLAETQKRDGAYFLTTNRDDLSPEEIFRTYMLLTRIESAFKDMKGPLGTHPNRHHREDRAETHIFQSILALHIMTAIEYQLEKNGDSRNWETIRELLRTHQICSVVLPSAEGKVYRVRKPSKMEDVHKEIYRKLGITASDKHFTV